jgi:diguanylate cyclase (GGDEF)-like protein
MAATDPNPRSDRLQPVETDCLAAGALRERLEEEIGRAERHGTGLSCLMVVIENLDELAREHGGELREQTIDYVAGALRHELRRFDRVGRAGRGGRESSSDLVIVLPGADSPRAEIVARRALERLRTIKVEAGGTRRPLEISVGLAAWREEVSAEALLTHARAALSSVNGDQTPTHPPSPEAAATHARHAAEPKPAPTGADAPPAVGHAGGS